MNPLDRCFRLCSSCRDPKISPLYAGNPRPRLVSVRLCQDGKARPASLWDLARWTIYRLGRILVKKQCITGHRNVEGDRTGWYHKLHCVWFQPIILASLQQIQHKIFNICLESCYHWLLATILLSDQWYAMDLICAHSDHRTFLERRSPCGYLSSLSSLDPHARSG